MQNSENEAALFRSETSWSNRFLIIGTAGILFLTIYPFRFYFHVLANGASPFLLGRSAKSGVFDAILNVLLFMPFGFGLGEKLRERGKSVQLILGVALATGMLFSYTIEFLQLYVPERDSGWEDVFTNGSGSLVGAGLFVLLGARVVRFLNSMQRSIAAAMTPMRFAVVAIVYFLIWFGLAATLQKQTQFQSWQPGGNLVLGDTGTGWSARQGAIQNLEFWNHALTREAMAEGPTAMPDLAQNGTPIAVYDSSKPTGNEWSRPTDALPVPVGEAPSPLPLQMSAANLIESLKATNQFSVHVVCNGVPVPGDEWRIFAIGDGSGAQDMMLRQETAHLVFWVRTPLTMGHANLAWYIPRIFSDPHRQHEMVYSYDGANLLLYLDGKRLRPNYKVGPGPALAKLLRKIRPAELELYTYAFYALVFLLGGVLMGLLEPKSAATSRAAIVTVEAVGIGVAAVILEVILVKVTGKTFSWQFLALAIVLGLAGLWWANADGRAALGERAL
jgi:glycopeptide antibiotics resistance protein